MNLQAAVATVPEQPHSAQWYMNRLKQEISVAHPAIAVGQLVQGAKTLPKETHAISYSLSGK
jgi:hypothetical protein